MAMPYPHRSVRPLYPEIPDTVCDCALLPNDYPTLPEELIHTTLIHAQALELALDEGRKHAHWRIEIRHCTTCDQWWWAESSQRTDIT